MSLLSTRSGELANDQPQRSNREWEPQTDAIGDWIAHQVLGDRFGLSDDYVQSFSNRLPWELQKLVIPWLLFYLSWLSAEYAASKYGPEFAQELRMQVKKRFTEAEVIWRELRGLGKVFQFWMDALDDASSLAPTALQTVQAPVEAFAASAFLTKDPGSPFYESGGPTNLDFNIGNMLASVRDKVVSSIQTVIDTGVPGNKSGT